MTKNRKPYHHGNLRERLLRVVRDLVEEVGPNGFTVAEAARRAEVSSAAPYKHFADRTDLLNGLVADAMDRLRDAMIEGRDAHPPGSSAAITAIGMAYVEFAKAEPNLFRLMFGVTGGHKDDPDLRAKGEATFGIVVEAVARRLAIAPTGPEAARTAYLLWTVVHGHSFLSIDDKRKTSADDASDHDLISAATEGLLGAG